MNRCRNLGLIVSLIVSILVTSSLAADPPARIRVLTYNIHHGRGTDEKIDLPRIAKIIRDANPDIVALQEVDNRARRSDNVDQAAELAKLTGMRGAFAKAIEFDGGEYGLAVLSRFAISKQQVHALPNHDDHEARIAFETEIDLPQSNLIFVCTHLDHTRDSQTRFSQARAINQIYSDAGQGRVILAGDLNATLDQPAMKQLTNWLPSDVMNLAPTIPAAKPTRKIDYVMLRKADAWRTVETRVIAEPVASDHAPLLVELELVSGDTRSDRPIEDRLLTVESAIDQRSRIATIDEWKQRKTQILDAMQSIMGPLPGESKRCPLEVQIQEEVDCGSYVRRLISYQSEPNNRVPAYFCIPKSALAGESVSAGVLCLHPTDNVHGHKVVVGLGGLAGRQYATELAERGFVTLAPAYPLLANYQPDLDKLGYSSGTMKAIWDNIRGIDLLESLTYVRRGGIGAIGHSLGGHNAVYTAAFDDRIKVVVSCCGLDSYVDYMQGDIRGWTSTRYMPKLIEYAHCIRHVPFDFHEIIGCIAPRRCLIVAPLHDSNFEWQSVDRIATAASAVYALHNHADQLTVEHPDCEHDFPQDMRQLAYETMQQTLITSANR